MISLSSRSSQYFGLSCVKWVALRPAKVLILIIRPPRSFTASKNNCSYQATIELHMQPEIQNKTHHIQSHSITIGHTCCGMSKTPVVCLISTSTVSMKKLICRKFLPATWEICNNRTKFNTFECASQDMSSQRGENWHQGKMALCGQVGRHCWDIWEICSFSCEGTADSLQVFDL